MQDPSKNAAPTIYWQRTVRLTQILLFLCLGATFCIVFFARELSGITVLGWPLSSYMAGQGIVVINVLIVGIYAWCMDRLDRLHEQACESRRKHEITDEGEGDQ